MQDITYNGYHLPTIAKLAKELGSPTHDGISEFIWRFSNTSGLPYKVAKEFMLAAGYVPFVGFPLQRKAVQP